MHLFPGEELRLTRTRDETIAPPSDAEINEKYVKGEVRIVTEQARYPLGSIPSMVESRDYELNPEFQRRHRWDDHKKRALRCFMWVEEVPLPARGR
jgi:hypothetical protein